MLLRMVKSEQLLDPVPHCAACLPACREMKNEMMALW